MTDLAPAFVGRFGLGREVTRGAQALGADVGFLPLELQAEREDELPELLRVGKVPRSLAEVKGGGFVGNDLGVSAWGHGSAVVLEPRSAGVRAAVPTAKVGRCDGQDTPIYDFKTEVGSTLFAVKASQKVKYPE